MPSRQIRFRTGMIGAAGGPPLHTFTKRMKTVTADSYQISITTAGDTGVFDVANLGEPAELVATTSFTHRGTGSNHPSEHPAIVLAGYQSGRVLSSFFRFDVRFIGGNSAAKDFVFAYKFSIVSTAAQVFTAGTVTIDNFKDMRQSRGWVWKRFSGVNSGGSIYPSQGRIEVKIPSVWKLTKALFESQVQTEEIEEGLEQVVADGGTVSLLRPFLHVSIFTIDGTAFEIDTVPALDVPDVVFDVTVFQNIVLYRAQNAANMIDEADQTS